MSTTKHERHVVFLGPQRHAPSARETLEELIDGADRRPIAVVTAGWEEREAEDAELSTHLGRPVINLSLHQRALSVFDEDPGLLTAVQTMHDELTELQRLYRLQLRHLVAAARELLERPGSEELLEDHRTTAFENLTNLDTHHIDRVQRIRQQTMDEHGLRARRSLARHREEIAAALRDASAVCIAGGHVGVLYNRLWMFDVLPIEPAPSKTPIVAWSAGAMVLSERILLFHDDPPEGGGHAELLGPGLGMFPGIIPFPHAKHRLLLDDPVRVQLLTRRFPSEACLAFDNGAQASWIEGTLQVGETTRRFELDGAVTVAGGV